MINHDETRRIMMRHDKIENDATLGFIIFYFGESVTRGTSIS